ncbi:hypothetical protein AZE42_11337 [Rhizopogon vesiculosus]|uniref:Uncharacterized protein n=1 Tax=Rhizopogon vesiculosus TaxID=180088 RepID=A0A1J8QTL1_9AGAM|nr:hypothetical protein AZE42_11337 [Rhizopogon vesiculosus]
MPLRLPMIQPTLPVPIIHFLICDHFFFRRRLGRTVQLDATASYRTQLHVFAFFTDDHSGQYSGYHFLTHVTTFSLISEVP